MGLIDANKKRLAENMQTYRKRQAIVEHPFGIIKYMLSYVSDLPGDPPLLHARSMRP